MEKINSWGQLLVSDIVLKARDVTIDIVGKQFAVVHHNDAELVRYSDHQALTIWSVVHIVDFLPKIVVQYGRVIHKDIGTERAYLVQPTGEPHYWPASDLGLTDNWVNPKVLSVLVPIEVYDRLEFTTGPASLNFKPTPEEMRIINTSLEE